MKALESKELGRQVAYQCIAYEVLSGDMCHVNMRTALQLAVHEFRWFFLACKEDMVSPAFLIESADLKIETLDGVKPW
ncbi:hypothetical protein E2C01_015903 [Portunus trituberculatus]|uniref:Uncharacterized protein n=1 Tax=Portunus trituberculatus TaxID=210409 RepID=A0A5B7DPM8_PORTR|nr:hypothetical protein [Portunus trituberculatus]